jgi:uncharacterized protein YjiS (DUF1127 family)
MQYATWLRPPSASQLTAIFDGRLPAQVDRILVNSYRTVSGWRERAEQRRRLMQLPDDRLRDIGVSRLEAVREAQKPFWRR